MAIAPSSQSPTSVAAAGRGADPRRRPPPRRVDHTYRDFSRSSAADGGPGRNRKQAAVNFPSKLHQILSTEEFAHIISWMPHGRAWKIHDRALLVKEVVPRFFVQSKYESFTRQLNGWGFKRLHQSGNDFNAYYHECFLRGLPHLTALLKRVPAHQGKLIPHVEAEPNFYEIDKRFPLPSPAHYPHPYPPGHGHGVHPPPLAGYPEQYASHPGGYGPPPPPHYYSAHRGPGGPPGHANAAAAYPPPPGYPPHAFYAAPAGQYAQHGHPYHHADPYFGPPPTSGAAPANNDEFPWSGSHEETPLVREEGKGDCLEPLGMIKGEQDS